MELLLAIFAGGSLLLSGFSIPMIRNKVPPNLFYGVRIPRTFADEAVWYAVNRFAGKRLLIVGLVSAALAIGLYFIPGITIDSYAWIFSGVFLVLFAIVVIQIWNFIKRLP